MIGDGISAYAAISMMISTFTEA
jgi:hypothetical protein